MAFFRVAAILITLAAVFGYVNYRWVRMPTTIGIMLIALFMSVVLLLLHPLGVEFDQRAKAILATVDFNEALMQGMLAFLLFAGALHVDVGALRSDGWVVGLLATVGVVASAVIIGFLTWGLVLLLELPVPFVYCFLFGALISPTDPIAVLGIMQSVGVPKSLETKITGESLFNDGVGVVVFVSVLEVATGARALSPHSVAMLFGREALGGAVFGLATGWVAYRMLKSVDNYKVEVLISLALVMGTYSFAAAFDLSGPIAVVVAGLLTGSRGRRLAMSDMTRERLDNFWELIDEILNALLFVLIGLEVLVLPFSTGYLIAAIAAIPIVLLARYLSVALAVKILLWPREFGPHTVRILTWAGLRGGISVALALGLPRVPARDLIVEVTYAVVLFSILVQGLSIGWVIKRSGLAPPRAAKLRAEETEEEPPARTGVG